jgi:putative hydroxymethylpyrimidine transport system substrate-binding protein
MSRGLLGGRLLRGLTPRLAAVVLSAAALALGLAACGDEEDPSTGSASNPRSFTLALDWYVNPDHVGIFTAIDQDLFRQAGLEVKPQVPSDPSAPIKQVAAGRVDLAISYEPEVLLATEQGLDVMAVGALVGSPLTSLISLPRGEIDSAADLSGKTVGTAGIPYQSDYLETVLQTASVSSSSVEEVNVGLNLMPALIGGRVDAILGGFRNIEGVELRLRGLQPRIVPVDQLGVPTYDELVLVARKSTVEDQPEAIRVFIQALARGTDYARAHPQEAANAVLAASKGLDPTQTRAEVAATLPLLAPPQGRPYGYLDPNAWRAYAAWMAQHELISEAPPTGDVLTNELLP